MLSRNWGALFAAIGLTVVAFGTGTYFAALGYGHGEEQCAKAANGASYAEQDCPRQIDTDRHGLPYLAESIASNPEPKDSAEREQRDLAAQESMSVWTFWMMAFSAVGIVITSIGTGLLLWQIILTRRAVEDTGAATEAMRESNKIAKIGADATAKALRLQAASSRPLMIFDIENASFEGPPFESPWGDPEHGLDHHIRPTFSFKNIGSQPCWIESAWLTFYIKERDYKGGTSDTSGILILPDGLSDVFRVANAGFVQPGQSIDCGGGFYGVQKEEIEIIEKGGGVIIFGMCQYRSLAGEIHCTQYAYHVPIQRPHNKSLGHGYPVANSTFWRDGIVKTAKLGRLDPLSWIED